MTTDDDNKKSRRRPAPAGFRRRFKALRLKMMKNDEFLKIFRGLNLGGSMA